MIVHAHIHFLPNKSNLFLSSCFSLSYTLLIHDNESIVFDPRRSDGFILFSLAACHCVYGILFELHLVLFQPSNSGSDRQLYLILHFDHLILHFDLFLLQPFDFFLGKYQIIFCSAESGLRGPRLVPKRTLILSSYTIRCLLQPLSLLLLPAQLIPVPTSHFFRLLGKFAHLALTRCELGYEVRYILLKLLLSDFRSKLYMQ